MKDKKAISPTITTVILIVLVIIIAIIILLWYQGFIKEKLIKFDKPVENVCDEISLRTFFTSDPVNLGFDNIGNVPIYAVDLQIESGGNINVVPLGGEKGGKVNPGLTSVLDYGVSSDDKIKIIPVLLGKAKDGSVKPFTCPENKGIIAS